MTWKDIIKLDRENVGPNTNGVFTPEQDNDKTNVEPVHSYDTFHTRFVWPGVKGFIGMQGRSQDFRRGVPRGGGPRSAKEANNPNKRAAELKPRPCAHQGSMFRP